MDSSPEIRAFVQNLLTQNGDKEPLTDTSSFLLSGRLNSVDAVEIVVFLEEKFAIDFSSIGFDQEKIDSIAAIETLIRDAAPNSQPA